jgi:PKD repeat protein
MKKITLILFLALVSINLQAQCNSNPISDNGASGTLNFSDSSSVTPGWSLNYSVSYLWDFGDGTSSTQQNPCHTYGDLSNISFPLYATLTVTYFDSTTINYCIDTDSVQVYILMNPCNYGNLQISASGTNLSADWTYNIGGTSGCANNYPDTYLWSNGDTTQTISVNSFGTYTCTVTTTTGCVYTSTYSYNGSFTPTFDCNLIDFNELNNNLDTLTISSNYLNNNFPEVIDSLSFWEAYSTDGNVNLLGPLYANPISFVNIGGFNGSLSDTFIVCANVFLYDSLYQHNLQASPPLGSSCYTCETIAWDSITSSWNSLPTQCDASFSVYQQLVFDSLNPNNVVPVPNSLIIENLSTGNGLTYSWDLGDGNTATGYTVSHTYATPGPFNLCLTVSDATGCSDVFCDSIGVNSAGLSIGKQSGFSISMTGIDIVAQVESNLEVDYMFNLYPNPTIGYVNVEVGVLSEMAKLSVLDLTGRVVYSEVIESSSSSQLVTIDLATIPTGIYQVSLDTQEGFQNKRLIVK